MANYKVTANFQDKTDMKVYVVGDSYEGQDESRINYLVSQKFIEKDITEANEQQKARNQQEQDQAKEQNTTNNKAAKSVEQMQQEAQNQSQETGTTYQARGKKTKETGK